MNRSSIRRLASLAALALMVGVAVASLGPPDAGAYLRKVTVPLRWRNPSWSISSTPSQLSPDTVAIHLQSSAPETLEVDLGDLIIPPHFDVTSGDSLSWPFGSLTFESDTLNGIAALDSLTMKVIGIPGTGLGYTGLTTTLLTANQKLNQTGFLVDSVKVFPAEAQNDDPLSLGNQSASVTLFYGGGTSTGQRFRVNRQYVGGGLGGAGAGIEWRAGVMWRRLLETQRMRVILTVAAGGVTGRSLRAYWTYWRDAQ